MMAGTQPSSVKIDADSAVHAISISPDGKYFVSGNQRTVQVWHVEDGEWKIAATLISSLFRCRCHAISISNDGMWIATGTSWGWLCVWSAETFEKVFAINEDSFYEVNNINGVDFSPDASKVVSASESRTATVWDVATCQQVQVLRHDSTVRAAKYSPQGDRIATAQSRAIRIWDTDDGGLLFDIKITETPRYNNGLLWSKDHIFIVSGAEVKELNASTGLELSVLPAPNGNESSSLSLLNEGEIIVHAADRNITFWHTSTREQLGFMRDPQDSLAIAPFPDSHFLAVGGDDGKITFRNLSSITDSILSYLHPTFKEPDIQIDGATLDLWKTDQLMDAEAILTIFIDESQDPSHHDIASRSIIRTRLNRPRAALVDAETAIRYTPSLLGYIAKALAHVRNGEKDKGYQACDIAFEHFHSSHVTFILLIKAVIMFMAGEHLNALSRIDDLIAAVHYNTICRVVQAYMHLLLGGLLMERHDYDSAVQSFKHAQDQVRPHASQPLLVISLISGWDFDDLGTVIRQRLCEALYSAGHTDDAIKCFHSMTSELGMEITLNCERLEWSSSFRKRFIEKSEHLGDTAMDTQQYEEAIRHYSNALSLDHPSPQSILIRRLQALMVTKSWLQAADDASQIIELDPSSQWGYEMRHAALHQAGDYDNSIKALELMQKIAESPNRGIQRKGDKYIAPSSTQAAIRKVAHQALRRLPRVLINTETGRLHDRAEQITLFQASSIYKELVSSMTTRIDNARIKREVRQYFRYVMFSHRWEENEPLFHQMAQISVYDLGESPTHDKLQTFCKIVREAGFNYAWSDTCCINKSDNFILQEALVAMFKWYEGAALTIVFLRGVPAIAKRGALGSSVWNTRAWTLQEYVASKVVRFYTEDWTPYLGIKLSNHKESPEVISEMEEATGVSAQRLMSLRPGLSSIREKLRLASTRQTTLVEDAAYSLLGILSVTGLPAIYGEGDASVGRLLAHVLAGSGDVSILAWTGDSGGHNSCLPAHITVFNEQATSHLPHSIPITETERCTTALESSSFDLDGALSLYDRLSGLPAPWFAANRMKLPCIAFQLPPFSLTRTSSGRVYRTETPIFGTIEIKARFDLSRIESLVLVHPWLDNLLEQQEIHGGVSVEDLAPVASPISDDEGMDETEIDDGTLSLAEPEWPPHPAAVRTVREPMSRETRARRLVARLRKPFGALLLALVSGDYRRIVADNMIRVRIQESVALTDILDNVRTLDVL